MKHNPSIKNLIFDLGGVILDLSVDQTMEQFSALSGLDKQKVKDLYASTPGFEEYEKGLMSDKDFRDFVRAVFAVQSSDEEIDTCWTAMLLGLTNQKIESSAKPEKEFFGISIEQYKQHPFELYQSNNVARDHRSRKLAGQLLPSGLLFTCHEKTEA